MAVTVFSSDYTANDTREGTYGDEEPDSGARHPEFLEEQWENHVDGAGGYKHAYHRKYDKVIVPLLSLRWLNCLARLFFLR